MELTSRVLALSCFLLLVTGCADKIPRAELLRRIEAGEAPSIVDVRSRSEYEAAHVPGAVHLPFYAVLSRSEAIPGGSEGEEPLVVYCEHGPRAGIARAQLWFAVDRPVRFMEGHMTAWKRDGLPVANDPEAEP